MALEVDEEHVVPLAPVRGARLDAGQAHLVPRERLEQPVERPGGIGVTDRYEGRGSVGATWRKELAAQDQKARGVVGAVLDLGRQDLEPVDLGGRLSRSEERRVGKECRS